MTEAQQTPDTQINIKVDTVEPVVLRIVTALESIAKNLDWMAGSVGPFKVTCKNEKCRAVTMQARKTALYCSSSCKLTTQKRRQRKKAKERAG